MAAACLPLLATLAAHAQDCPFEAESDEAAVQLMLANVTGVQVAPGVAAALAGVFASGGDDDGDSTEGAVREQADLSTMTDAQAATIMALSKQAMGNLTAPEAVRMMTAMAPMLNPATGVSVKLASQFNQGGAQATDAMVALPDSELESFLSMYRDFSKSIDAEQFTKLWSALSPVMREFTSTMSPDEVCKILVGLSGMMTNMGGMISGFFAGGGSSAISNLNPATICPIVVLQLVTSGVTLTQEQCVSMMNSMLPALADADLDENTVKAMMTMMQTLAPANPPGCTPEAVKNLDELMGVVGTMSTAIPEGEMGAFYTQVGIPLSQVQDAADVKLMVGTMARLTIDETDKGNTVDEATMNLLLSMLYDVSKALQGQSQADQEAIMAAFKEIADKLTPESFLQLIKDSDACLEA